MSDLVIQEAERVIDEARASRFRAGWILRLPYPARQVLRRWRGTLGMVLGVGIALGMGMTLLGSSNAAMDIYTADFRLAGTDLYVVTEGGTMIPVLPSDSPGTIEHGRHVLGQIRAMPGVTAALGVTSWTMEREQDGPRRRDDPTELVATMGVDGDPSLIPNVLLLQDGRWLRRSDEVILGPKLAREKALRPGDALRLNSQEFTVVGIGELRGFGFNTDSVAYLDSWAFRQRVDLGDVFNIIAIETEQQELTRQRVRAVESLSVFDRDDLVRQAEIAMQTDVVTHWILILLTLAIAGLFVSSMLSGSVADRRLEFATMRALGIPTRTILLTVATEAILVSLAASFVGLAVATALGQFMNAYMAPSFGYEALYSANVGLLGLIIALALGLGLIAGLLPARQATRVDPVEVLREA